ncbi:PYK10-binding protein 2-like [Eucalyptus grandis]|uniref:PYK10-binding protein 2-like n=1 Tax=Eucalyptus grandis TaxID=71139 RepID=UPI00192EE60B|nr:PYK10-binding protein 2-like [Eucalyptus grandis]
MKLEGEYFSVPSKGGKVVQLLVSGNNNGFLTSIGARVKLQSENSRSASVQSVGLIGSKIRSIYSKWDDGNQHTDVRKIIYELDSEGGRFIQSIAFEYQEKDGGTWQSETHGVKGGKKEKSIEMGTGEYLTLMSGYWTDHGIKRLRFLTNKNRPITIGDENGIDEGDRVCLPTGGKIVGFYGWDFGKLRGIGAYFEGQPFAGEEDREENKFDGVREIYVMPMPDQSGFRYIRFLFDNGSEEGLERIHGKWTGEVFGEKQVQLKDYPREYLTSISGYVGEDGAIKSLTFYSNRGTRGRYGKEGDGKYFWYPSTGSRITGFYGTNGETLKSIGVYAEPIPYIYPSKISLQFGGSGGKEWDDGVHTNVRGFRVIACKANEKIESITFMYDDNGVLVEGSPHGRQDVSSGKWIWLDFPYERLTSIGVWTGPFERKTIIRGLRITTVPGFADPVTHQYGQCEKEPAGFTIKEDRHKIVGFFGRKAESHIISIGAHLEKI